MTGTNEALARDWVARFATEVDYEAAAAFRASFGDDNSVDPTLMAEFPGENNWKLADSPGGPGLLALAVAGERIVGTASITPKTMNVENRTLAAAESGDTFTDPAYQRQGVFSTLVGMNLDRAAERGIEVVYSHPNENSLPGYERTYNFKQSSALFMVNTVRPLRIFNTFSARLNRMLALAGTPIAAAYFALRHPLRRPTSEITRHTRIPSGLETFCERALGSFDVYVPRTRDYLSWRIDRNPATYRIYTLDGDSGFNGYLVTRVRTSGLLRVGYIADYVVDRGQPWALGELLRFALADFAEEGLDVASCWVNKNGPFYKVATAIGFRGFRHMPVVWLQNEIGKRLAQESLNWHFTMADSDNI